MIMQLINILGTDVQLSLLSRPDLKGLPLGIIIEFNIYKGRFMGNDYCFYQSKSGREYTPSVYAYYTQKIEYVVKLPTVLITNKHDYNNRTRLIEQGVYFVSTSKYAFLPNLVANTLSRAKRKKAIKQLSPKAQFLLLYWMQNHNLGMDVSISTFLDKWGFSYVSISRALAELEQFQLCVSQKNKDNSKIYRFLKDRKTTWEESQSVLRNPVSKIVYSNTPIPSGYRVANISALSHYSMLNPEDVDSVAVLDKAFRVAAWKEQTNEIEGTYRIEVWCYEPAMFEGEQYVDRLSLVLSLREDYDARVEGEVERVINEMPW